MDPREQESADSESSPISSRNTNTQPSSIDNDNDTNMTTSSSISKSSMDIDDDNSSDDDDDLVLSNNKNNKKPDRKQKSSSPSQSKSQSQSANNSKSSQSQSEEFDVEITEEDYESIAIMIDELMKDDPAVRIKAIRSLPIISKALGEDRTRNELIPYITQMIDDDDEVLLVLIEEIYRLLTLKLIGGKHVENNQYSYCLIPPFERLCQVEEKIIRDEATSKFGKIIYDMPYREYAYYFDQYVLPLFKRLCDCDWHTARISGATLIANAFSKFVKLLNEEKKNLDKDDMEIDENKDNNDKEKQDDNDNVIKRLERYKTEMLHLLTELCSDSIPIVRRSAIITLGKMVSCLDDSEEVLTNYLPLFKKLSMDDQDNVRVFAIETLIQFSHIFNAKQVKDQLLYHIRLLALDQAWRVRYIAADNFINLCKMLDKETIKESMVNYFLRLLEDQEPEVRAVAISKIPGISKLIGIKLSISKLIPIISQRLITDNNKYARASLASIIIPFCYLLPHQIVIDKILSCILKILKDEYPNVRLHVISNICQDDDEEDTDLMDQDEEDEDIDNNNDKSNKMEEIEVEIEKEVEYEEEIMVEIDEDGNEIEIDSSMSSLPNMDGRERKKIKRKKIRIEKQIQKQNMNKMKKFDISLLEESIIPSIMELTLDNDWRVRLGIIEKFPALAKQFGLKFFNERLFQLCLASLEDNVADIRLSAASNLFQISNIFNNRDNNNNNYEWTVDKLIPSLIKRIHESNHYLHRLVYLLSFKYLSEGLGIKQNKNLVKEIIYFMEYDQVANVRFKACQILTFLGKNNLINKEFIPELMSTLQTIIQKDDDQDVRYFANQTIDALSS